MSNLEPLSRPVEARATAIAGRSRLILAQGVVALAVATVYLPTAVAGAALAATLAAHPGEIAQRPWWANLWGGAGLWLIGWLAWKNRDLALGLMRRGPGRTAG